MLFDDFDEEAFADAVVEASRIGIGATSDAAVTAADAPATGIGE
jgi:hypothetical protein